MISKLVKPDPFSLAFSLFSIRNKKGGYDYVCQSCIIQSQ